MKKFNMIKVELMFVETTEFTGTVGSFVVDSENRFKHYIKV